MHIFFKSWLERLLLLHKNRLHILSPHRRQFLTISVQRRLIIDLLDWRFLLSFCHNFTLLSNLAQTAHSVITVRTIIFGRNFIDKSSLLIGFLLQNLHRRLSFLDEGQGLLSCKPNNTFPFVIITHLHLFSIHIRDFILYPKLQFISQFLKLQVVKHVDISIFFFVLFTSNLHLVISGLLLLEILRDHILNTFLSLIMVTLWFRRLCFSLLHLEKSLWLEALILLRQHIRFSFQHISYYFILVFLISHRTFYGFRATLVRFLTLRTAFLQCLEARQRLIIKSGVDSPSCLTLIRSLHPLNISNWQILSCLSTFEHRRTRQKNRFLQTACTFGPTTLPVHLRALSVSLLNSVEAASNLRK